MRFKTLGLALAALVVLTACPREDTSAIKERAVTYWENLFRGKLRAAYEMLDTRSRGFITYPDYARKVGIWPTTFKEVQDYWKAYYPLTGVEARDVSLTRNTATVALVLTQPDPTWFPDEVHAEAKRLGLEGPDYALFLLRGYTQALLEGKVPIVRIRETTRLVKEDDQWWIVFEYEE